MEARSQGDFFSCSSRCATLQVPSYFVHGSSCIKAACSGGLTCDSIVFQVVDWSGTGATRMHETLCFFPAAARLR